MTNLTDTPRQPQHNCDCTYNSLSHQHALARQGNRQSWKIPLHACREGIAAVGKLVLAPPCLFDAFRCSRSTSSVVMPWVRIAQQEKLKSSDSTFAPRIERKLLFVYATWHHDGRIWTDGACIFMIPYRTECQEDADAETVVAPITNTPYAVTRLRGRGKPSLPPHHFSPLCPSPFSAKSVKVPLQLRYRRGYLQYGQGATFAPFGLLSLTCSGGMDPLVHKRKGAGPSFDPVPWGSLVHARETPGRALPSAHRSRLALKKNAPYDALVVKLWNAKFTTLATRDKQSATPTQFGVAPNRTTEANTLPPTCGCSRTEWGTSFAENPVNVTWTLRSFLSATTTKDLLIEWRKHWPPLSLFVFLERILLRSIWL